MKTIEFSTCIPSLGSGQPLEMHRRGFNSISSAEVGDFAPADKGRSLNVEFWLPQAAKAMDISPDLNDYVIVPIIGFWTGVPNTNGDAVRARDTLAWRYQDGCCMYETFRRKGTYWNHQEHMDPLRASGIIFDSYMAPVKGIAGTLKLILLQGYCRQKNPELVNQILQRKITSYSVGMTYDGYEISTTGDLVTDLQQAERSITKPNQSPYEDQHGDLVFRYLQKPRGFECSAVPIPAFASAVGDSVIDVQSESVNHYD